MARAQAKLTRAVPSPFSTRHERGLIRGVCVPAQCVKDRIKDQYYARVSRLPPVSFYRHHNNSGGMCVRVNVSEVCLHCRLQGCVRELLFCVWLCA